MRDSHIISTAVNCCGAQRWDSHLSELHSRVTLCESSEVIVTSLHTAVTLQWSSLLGMELIMMDSYLSLSHSSYSAEWSSL